jgi:hypothetical protein
VAQTVNDRATARNAGSIWKNRSNYRDRADLSESGMLLLSRSEMGIVSTPTHFQQAFGSIPKAFQEAGVGVKTHT